MHDGQSPVKESVGQRHEVVGTGGSPFACEVIDEECESEKSEGSRGGEMPPEKQDMVNEPSRFGASEPALGVTKARHNLRRQRVSGSRCCRYRRGLAGASRGWAANRLLPPQERPLDETRRRRSNQEGERQAQSHTEAGKEDGMPEVEGIRDPPNTDDYGPPQCFRHSAVRSREDRDEQHSHRYFEQDPAT